MAKKIVELKIGVAVPEFEAESSSGNKISLKSLKGKKAVFYFYPKDMTPGCTLEGQEFNKLLSDFNKANTLIFGISRDNLKSHQKFIDQCGFRFVLLSDPEETLCNLFDVIKEKNMYGKKVMGIERSTFVIDEKGKLILEYRKVKAEGHAREVLNAIRELGK